jgi:hypothetical protein
MHQMESKMTYRTLTLALPLALMVAACKTTDSPDPLQAARTFQGSVDQDDPALYATGELDVTTQVRITSFDADGERTDLGNDAVDAQGAFEVGLGETDDRYLLVEGLDADGSLVGATMLDLRDADDGDSLTLDADSSIQALVWARIVEEEGDTRQDTAWIDAHLTAELRTEVHKYDDAGTEPDRTDLALQVIAEAAVSARAARDQYAASAGIGLSADTWAELSAESAAGGSASSFVADLDLNLAAEEVTAEQRERLYALMESSFRATLVTVFDAETSGTHDFSGMLRTAVQTSAWWEAEASAAALAAHDTSASDTFVAELIADLALAFDVAADDLGSDTPPATVVATYQAQTDLALGLAVSGLIDQLSEADRGALLIALGLDVSLTTDLAAAAIYDEAAAAAADYRASLSASAAAAVEPDGSFDGQGYVGAQLSAWANLESELSGLSEEVSGGEDALFTQAMLSSSSHFTFLTL